MSAATPIARWTGFAGTTSWQDPANWSTGVTPGTDGTLYDVYLPSGVGLVSVTNDVAVRNLTVRSGSDLRVAAVLTVTGSTLRNDGSLRIGRELRVAGTATTLVGRGTTLLEGGCFGTGVLASTMRLVGHEISGHGCVGFAPGIGRGRLFVDVDDTSQVAAAALGYVIVRADGRNRGLITNGEGVIYLSGAWNNADGEIRADGAFAMGKVTLTGGTLTVAPGGQLAFEREDGFTAPSRINTALTNAGTVTIWDGAELRLNGGTFTNDGVMRLNSAGATTTLSIAGARTIGGAGDIRLSDFPANRIVGYGNGAHLTIANDILGTGALGGNTLNVTSSGDITARPAGLTLDPATTFTNTATISSGAGSLVFDAGRYENEGGRIIVDPAGSATFRNGAYVHCGEVTNEGEMRLAGATIDGSLEAGCALATRVTSHGRLRARGRTNSYLAMGLFNGAAAVTTLEDGSTLTIDRTADDPTPRAGGGHVRNEGLVELAGSSLPTTLRSAGPIDLSGGGEVRLGGANSQIVAAQSVVSDSQRVGGGGLIDAPGVIGMRGTEFIADSGTPLTVRTHGHWFHPYLLRVGQGSAVAMAGDGALVNAGVLDVDGTLRIDAASPGVLSPEGSVEGIGVIAAPVDVQSGGVAPGGQASVGRLQVRGPFRMGPNEYGPAPAHLDIFGPTAAEYDRLAVTGTVTLAGTLDLNYSPAAGFGPFVVINNDGTDAITGQFTNAPAGVPFTAGAYTFVASYAGGTGNDLAIQRIA